MHSPEGLEDSPFKGALNHTDRFLVEMFQNYAFKEGIKLGSKLRNFKKL